MNDELLRPFDWYWSGRFWYCSLRRRDGTRVSGCGSTKPAAVADARLELKRVDRKREATPSQQKKLGDFVAEFILKVLYAEESKE